MGWGYAGRSLAPRAYGSAAPPDSIPTPLLLHRVPVADGDGPSLSVSPSTVMPNGVPASSMRR